MPNTNTSFQVCGLDVLNASEQVQVLKVLQKSYQRLSKHSDRTKQTLVYHLHIKKLDPKDSQENYDIILKASIGKLRAHIEETGTKPTDTLQQATKKVEKVIEKTKEKKTTIKAKIT